MAYGVPIRVGHKKHPTEERPASGGARNFRRKGDIIYADLGGLVPMTIESYPGISVEIPKGVFSSIALLGETQPYFPISLKDMVQTPEHDEDGVPTGRVTVKGCPIFSCGTHRGTDYDYEWADEAIADANQRQADADSKYVQMASQAFERNELVSIVLGDPEMKIGGKKVKDKQSLFAQDMEGEETKQTTTSDMDALSGRVTSVTEMVDKMMTKLTVLTETVDKIQQSGTMVPEEPEGDEMPENSDVKVEETPETKETETKETETKETENSDYQRMKAEIMAEMRQEAVKEARMPRIEALSTDFSAEEVGDLLQMPDSLFEKTITAFGRSPELPKGTDQGPELVGEGGRFADLNEDQKSIAQALFNRFQDGDGDPENANLA